MTYNKCICTNCNNQYATVIDNDEELLKESCPNCGKKQLQLTGPLSVTETNSLFSGGG